MIHQMIDAVIFNQYIAEAKSLVPDVIAEVEVIHHIALMGDKKSSHWPRLISRCKPKGNRGGCGFARRFQPDTLEVWAIACEMWWSDNHRKDGTLATAPVPFGGTYVEKAMELKFGKSDNKSSLEDQEEGYLSEEEVQETTDSEREQSNRNNSALQRKKRKIAEVEELAESRSQEIAAAVSSLDYLIHSQLNCFLQVDGTLMNANDNLLFQCSITKHNCISKACRQCRPDPKLWGVTMLLSAKKLSRCLDTEIH